MIIRRICVTGGVSSLVVRSIRIQFFLLLLIHALKTLDISPYLFIYLCVFISSDTYFGPGTVETVKAHVMGSEVQVSMLLF